MALSQSRESLQAHNVIRSVQFPCAAPPVPHKPRLKRRKREEPTNIPKSAVRRRTDLSMGILNTLARSSHIEHPQSSKSSPEHELNDCEPASPRPVKYSLQSVRRKNSGNKHTEGVRETASTYTRKPRTFQLQRPQHVKSSVAHDKPQKVPTFSSLYPRNGHESQNRNHSALEAESTLRQPLASNEEPPKVHSRTPTKHEQFETEGLALGHCAHLDNLAARDPKKKDNLEGSSLNKDAMTNSSTSPPKLSADHKSIHAREKRSSKGQNGVRRFCQKRHRSSPQFGLNSEDVKIVNSQNENSDPTSDAISPVKLRKVALHPEKRDSSVTVSTPDSKSTAAKRKPLTKLETRRAIGKTRIFVPPSVRRLRPRTSSSYATRLSSLRYTRNSRSGLRQSLIQVGGGSIFSRSHPQAQTQERRIVDDDPSPRKEQHRQAVEMQSTPRKSSAKPKAAMHSSSSSDGNSESVTRKRSKRLAQKRRTDHVIVIDDSDEEETGGDEVARAKEEEEFDITRLGFATLSLENVKTLKELPPCPFLDPLSGEEESEVAKLYRQNDSKEIKVIPSARIVLRAEDFKRLRGVRWLNDEVINAYVSLINMRNNSIFTELTEEERKHIPRTYVFNTFFYTRLTSGHEGYDYAGVRRWTGRDKVDVMKQDLLIFPVNLGNHHWVLAVIDQPRRTFLYLDSMAGSDKSGVLTSLRRWYCDELTDKYGENIAKKMDLKTWPSAYNRYMIRRVGILPTNLEPRKSMPRLARIPVQTDGGSCGVFIAKIADCLSLGLKIYFNQGDIPLVRRRIALDLLRGLKRRAGRKFRETVVGEQWNGSECGLPTVHLEMIYNRKSHDDDGPLKVLQASWVGVTLAFGAFGAFVVQTLYKACKVTKPHTHRSAESHQDIPRCLFFRTSDWHNPFGHLTRSCSFFCVGSKSCSRGAAIPLKTNSTMVPTFIPAALPHHLSNSFTSIATSRRRPRCISSRPAFFPATMIARPDSEGPPELEDFFNVEIRNQGKKGPPIKVATGRSSLKEGNCYEATKIAIQTALGNVQDPHLVHVTFGPLLDSTLVKNALLEELKDKQIIARSVDKKGASDVLEVLFLQGGGPSFIRMASVTENVVTDMDSALQKAAAGAARKAVQELDDPQLCTFLIFAHTPGPPDAARKGIDEAFPGAIAYGGPAISRDGKWNLFAQEEFADDPTDKQTVLCAAVAGSLSFLVSSVVKNWAQPAYLEALSYMTPQYVGDAERDLLTAIRYNDWEKFLSCFEQNGVPIDVKWSDKQNQTPLLAACARARTRMVQYLLEKGADVSHRNDGGFTAIMYTRMLSDYDQNIVRQQLDMLKSAGAVMQLTAHELTLLRRVTRGRIVEQ